MRGTAFLSYSKNATAMNRKKETELPTPIARQSDSEAMPDPKENKVTPAEVNGEQIHEQIEDEAIQTQIQRDNP